MAETSEQNICINTFFELSKVFFPVIFIKEISNFGSVDENFMIYCLRNWTELSLEGKMYAHKIVL